MARPLQSLLARKLPLLLLALALLAPALPAAAQTTGEADGGIAAITVTITLDEIVDPGKAWTGAEGFHMRGVVVQATVSGDVTGAAVLVNDIDADGPCDAMLDCEGSQQSFATVELRNDEQTWSGSVALELPAGARESVHGILVGRHGASDQVIVLDTVISATPAAIELSGTMITLTGPIAGIHLSGSACLTGPTTADGGFIGTNGLVRDSGPLRVARQTLGGDDPTGIYGETRQLGAKGNLRGIFIAGLNARHAHGNFVLAGESGPYSGILGYGRATATIAEEPRCESGLQITSTWTGQVRYVTDPAAFLAPRVYFVTPADGATVSTPVPLEFGAENVIIEAPSGEARPGTGHLTLIIDEPCVGPGEPIPDDDAHIQIADGALAGSLSIFTGAHRLCLQLTDGSGIAQPATDVITIQVTSSEPPPGF